jgi:Protein of unknown function (DUF2442)
LEILLDVVRVEARADHTLLLELENGELRVFDITPFLDSKPFQPLKAVSLFAKASVAQGTVVWPGGLDIAPETLYDRGKKP